MIGDALTRRGIEVDVSPAKGVTTLDGYDAVVVAGALYANRWHRHARRFVRRQVAALSARPVWLVSSGPLDESARSGDLEPVRQVADLAARVGALGTLTFGGRLEADAKGFPASAMAKTKAGDWRNGDQVDQFASTVAAELARPGDDLQ